MYGHVETPRPHAQQCQMLRNIQKETGGFTEFVPLSLIYEETSMCHDKLVPEVRAGATVEEVDVVL